MPLKKGKRCKTKKCRRAAVSANIAELKNANKSKPRSKKRSQEQIVAIAMQSVYGRRRRKK